MKAAIDIAGSLSRLYNENSYSNYFQWKERGEGESKKNNHKDVIATRRDRNEVLAVNRRLHSVEIVIEGTMIANTVIY